jgi:Integrase core domain
MQPHMKGELVTDALRIAWFRRRPEPSVIVHSDRGSQYCSGLFQDTLKAYGMRSSTSRRGDCRSIPPNSFMPGLLCVKAALDLDSTRLALRGGGGLYDYQNRMEGASAPSPATPETALSTLPAKTAPAHARAASVFTFGSSVTATS